jgi:hypothetical protein
LESNNATKIYYNKVIKIILNILFY